MMGTAIRAEFHRFLRSKIAALPGPLRWDSETLQSNVSYQQYRFKKEK